MHTQAHKLVLHHVYLGKWITFCIQKVHRKIYDQKKEKIEKNNTKTESCSAVQQSQNKLYIRFKFGDNNFKMNRK